MSSTPEDPPWLRTAAVPVTLVIGALVTLQSQVNGELAHRLGVGPRAGVLAAVISFGSGLVILSLLMLALARWRRDLGRLRDAVRAGGVRRWHLLGGVAGGTLVAAQGLTVSTIGVSLFVVAVVAGQTSGGLAVDHVGLGPAGPAPVSVTRVLGAVLAVSAVAVTGGLVGGSGPGATALLIGLFPLLAGAATSVQQAINGLVARVSSPWVATWNNFLVGTVALVLAWLLTLVLPGEVRGLPGAPWLYIGGALGILFIASAALLVRVVGVLLFALGTVAGSVLSAVALDLVVSPEVVTAATYAGAALTLLGVAIAALGQRRARRRARVG